jgi:hypothetical protein
VGYVIERRSSLKNLLFLAVLVIGATGVWAGDLAGVTMPDSVQVGEDTLALNGMGLRKKAIIKVYVAGLYLAEPSSEPQEILAADSARMTRMSFRYGVKAGQLCDGWKEGLENNTPSASAAVSQQFETLCGFMEDMGKGEEMVYTFQPGEGTTVEVKGNVKGTIEGKPFADALWGCWIGPNPPSTAFREGLLGTS